MLHISVFHECFAVICRNHHQGVIRPFQAAELPYQISYQCVDVADRTVIQPAKELQLYRRDRLRTTVYRVTVGRVQTNGRSAPDEPTVVRRPVHVREMRIPSMNPGHEWFRGMIQNPLQQAVGARLQSTSRVFENVKTAPEPKEGMSIATVGKPGRRVPAVLEFLSHRSKPLIQDVSAVTYLDVDSVAGFALRVGLVNERIESCN